MPTSSKIKKALIQALPEQIQGTIVELGSGWGTLVFALADRYPQCKVIGYEISPIPYFVSQILKIVYKHKNVQFKRKDFFKEPLSEAAMAVCYLYPGAMQKLKSKFEKEGSPKSIVSHTFSIPGWTPEKTIEVHDLYRTKIYFYHRILHEKLQAALKR